MIKKKGAVCILACILSSVFSSAVLITISQSDETNIPSQNRPSYELANQDGDWTKLTPGLSPSPRSFHAMAYNDLFDVVVVFSGVDQSEFDDGVKRDTWAYSWDSNSWINMNPGLMPQGGNYLGAMVYNSKRNAMILFGGNSSETWCYDYGNNTWTNLQPSLVPPKRFGHAMVYDLHSDGVILFGGKSSCDNKSGTLYNDTWKYHYTTNTWENVTPNSSPQSRWYHNMAYDVEANRVILLGGETYDEGASEFVVMDDTWIYDVTSSTWMNVTPVDGPEARARSVMVFDGSLNYTLLYGGSNGTGEHSVLLGDTWVYDFNQNDWLEMTPLHSPQNRMGHSMIYASHTGQILLFGGSTGFIQNDTDETWTYLPTYQTRVPNAPTLFITNAYIHSDGCYELNWIAPDYDGGLPITGYNLYRGEELSSISLIAELGVTYGYRDYAVSRDEYYVYRVAAVNLNGEGLKSNKVDTEFDEGGAPYPPSYPGSGLLNQLIASVLYGGLTFLVIIVIIWQINKRKRR